MERAELVHQRFIERWADRFQEIKRKQGELAARGWGRTFLNEEDRARVVEELNRRKGGS